MDNTTIQELAKIINDNWIEKNQDNKEKINKVLKRKSLKHVLSELTEAINTSKILDKNKATLFVVLALLRRNLDCKEELGQYLAQYGMINFLYGGLIQFLNGKSESFKIEIKWNIYDNSNCYEFIFRFPAPEYWRFIDLILAASILLEENHSDKFESVLLKDKSNLLLLNSIHNHKFIPSEKFIINLLNENSNLRRSIGLYMLINPIEEILKNKANNRKNYKTLLNEKIEFASKMIITLPDYIQAELLVNYFLYNKRADTFLSFLAKLMINPILTESLINEINSPKVKILDDLVILLTVIRKSRSKYPKKHKCKEKLYNAITKKIQDFIKTDSGIYSWDELSEYQFGVICNLLPKKNKVSLKVFIQKISRNLMISKLDELVRYEMYLKDISKLLILSGMEKIVNSNLSNKSIY
ncbi:hypothetical protein [Viridibacillus arvi]|uniref:Uncharacterized protein n=1 Tax=Viridibacillus arvi TaxID=263475 RepID=A0A0M0LA44_9BACL|nr:hypothetical protein [Viridibacillus arvi]KOO47742.1 hypothetical protein AMD00_19055 [Viridibacillus arvi]